MAGILADKITIVTGGLSGIGLATVEAYVAEGAKVVVGDIDDAAGAALVERLGEATHYVRADVTDPAQIEGLVVAAVERYGRLDVMFNNAAATGDPSGLVDVTPEGFDRTVALVLRSVVLGHTYAARQFIAQGTGGSIISTASVAGIQGGWGATIYAIAKAGVIGTVRAATADLARYGIRSNAIAPGVIATPSIASAFGVPREQQDEFIDFIAERLAGTHPLGRLGRGSDIAGAAVFFASDLSEFVSGVVLPVDGGATSVTASPIFELAAAAGQEFLTR